MINNLSYLYSNYHVIASKHDFIKQPTVYYGTYDNPVNILKIKEQEDAYYNFTNFVDWFFQEN